MAEEINNQQTLTDVVDVTTAGGGRNDSDEVVTNLKDTLGKALGRTFKDDETALAAVKETFNYVGWTGKVRPAFEQLKAKLGGEDAAIKYMDEQSKPTQSQPEIKPAPVQDEAMAQKVAGLEKMVKDSQFYSDKPEFKPYKSLIDSLGSDPEKVVASEVFKTTHSKLMAHDEAEKTKSVIHSNPRIGQATDKVTKARDAVKAGNQSEASALAIDSVLDAFERK